MFFFLPITGVFTILGAMVCDDLRVKHNEIERVERSIRRKREERLEVLEQRLEGLQDQLDASRGAEREEVLAKIKAVKAEMADIQNGMR